MDQLKVILAVLKKHHFWVLGGVVLILLLGIWWQSTAGIAKEYDGRKGALKRHFADISTLAGAVDPPNEGVIAAIVRVHDKLFDNVLKAWKYLYEQQQEKNRLPDDLGPEFIARWNSLKADDPIPDEYRDIYWTFITNYLPKQLKRVRIWRPKEGQEEHRKAAGGLMPEGGRHRDEDVEYVGLVVWDQGNYEQFQLRLNWSRRPSTEQIRLAQEDLWVCDTLLNIVRDLNEGAQSHYSAPVKRIIALDIGREATKAFAEAQNALQFGNLLGAAGTSGTAAPGANPMGEGMSQPPVMEPGMMGEGRMGMEMGMEMGPGMMMPGNLALGDGLLAGRYVNESAQPIPVEKGIAKHPYREFKMMPIRLSLVMDQRKIPELMVQCANSNMPIRVRQLRLSPGQAAKVDYLGQAATAPGRNLMPAAGSPRERGNFPMGLPGEMGNPQAGGGEDMMPGAGGLRGAGKGSYRGPYDMPVEILGIIYIYNFADPKVLGKGPAEPGTESAPAPTTPATTPSTTPGTTPAVPPGTTPAVPPGTTPAVPPGMTPAVPPGTTPAVPPGTAPATVPATTPAAKPGTAPAEAPAKG